MDVLPFQSQSGSCGNAGGGSVRIIYDSSCMNGYHITLYDAASAMQRVLSSVLLTLAFPAAQLYVSQVSYRIPQHIESEHCQADGQPGE
jgi:hypothetical protein